MEVVEKRTGNGQKRKGKEDKERNRKRVDRLKLRTIEEESLPIAQTFVRANMKRIKTKPTNRTDK